MISFEFGQFVGYTVGPFGALVYAIWHNHKTEERLERKEMAWKEALAQNVYIVESMAKGIQAELDTCHKQYESLYTKVFELVEKNGYLSAKVDILERMKN